MTLYLLDHRHWIDDEYYDTKLIGIFSSNSLTNKTIEQYSRLPGFCDFKSDFHIKSFDIFLTKKKQKRKIVYLLTMTQILDDDEITVSYCLYSNIFLAKTIQIIKSVVLCGKKKKIYLSKHCIDGTDWQEGFVSVY